MPADTTRLDRLRSDEDDRHGITGHVAHERQQLRVVHLDPFKVWPARYSQNLGWPVARSYMSRYPGERSWRPTALLQLLRHDRSL